jgi:hypothetical protein
MKAVAVCTLYRVAEVGELTAKKNYTVVENKNIRVLTVPF